MTALSSIYGKVISRQLLGVILVWMFAESQDNVRYISISIVLLSSGKLAVGNYWYIRAHVYLRYLKILETVILSPSLSSSKKKKSGVEKECKFRELRLLFIWNYLERRMWSVRTVLANASDRN